MCPGPPWAGHEELCDLIPEGLCLLAEDVSFDYHNLGRHCRDQHVFEALQGAWGLKHKQCRDRSSHCARHQLHCGGGHGVAPVCHAHAMTSSGVGLSLLCHGMQPLCAEVRCTRVSLRQAPTVLEAPDPIQRRGRTTGQQAHHGFCSAVLVKTLREPDCSKAAASRS